MCLSFSRLLLQCVQEMLIKVPTFQHYFEKVCLKYRVIWVSCHHSMACTQVPGGENGFQIWRVPENILNKQLWTVHSHQVWGLDAGLTNSHFPNTLYYKILHRTLNLYMNRSLRSLMQQEMDMRFGTWNVRNLQRTGSLKRVTREPAKYKLDLVGVKTIPEMSFVSNVLLTVDSVKHRVGLQLFEALGCDKNEAHI